MKLYIHLARHEFQEARSSSEASSSGYHAIFAFEILNRPFAEFRRRAWNPMMAGHLIEAWDRQIHLIESLHLPGIDLSCNPVFELRFIACPDRSQVNLFFLGKTFAPTSDQAQTEALALGREVFSLFPFDFVLHPLSNQTDFEQAYQSEWIANLECPEQITEIRRFERLVTNSDNGNDINLLYLTHDWQWHLQSMDQVWCALAKYRQRLMFSVSLSPILWDATDYMYLNEFEVAIGKDSPTPAPASEIASALKLYRQLLYQTPRPFTMRMVLVGEPTVPRGLANAVGVGLCFPPLQAESNGATLSANYTLAWPERPTDFSLAKLNLSQLSQCDWGPNLVSLPIRRLRYAVNARQAQAAFRIPIPPEAGFPDISVGREVD